MVEVIGTAVFEAWYLALGEKDTDAVDFGVGLLEERGAALPFPYCSAIRDSRYPLRELRIQSGGRPIRVLYAFDPRRRAVLLIGGDKTGDERFYRRMVRFGEKLWVEYLASLQGGES